MSKTKLSELVAKRTGDGERVAAKAATPAETAIPAVDAVQGGNTAIQKTLKTRTP